MDLGWILLLSESLRDWHVVASGEEGSGGEERKLVFNKLLVYATNCTVHSHF